MSLYHLSVTLHILAAMVWLGGTFFLALVGAPELRTIEDVALRSELFRRIGRRFRRVGWSSVAVLVVTGFANLHYRGLLDASIMGSREFWGGPYGRWLAWKLGLVAAILLSSALHDLWIGPRASRSLPGSHEALRLNRFATWLARVGAVLGVLLVAVAVRLVRG
jgi:uncharacterized membrane protein